MFQVVPLTPTATGAPGAGSQETQTGAQTFTSVLIEHYKQLAVEFVCTSVSGSTPTLTFTVYGSLDELNIPDASANWYPLLYVTDSSDTAANTGIALTAQGAKVIFADNTLARKYKRFRLVTSAATATVNYYVNAYKIG